MLDPNVGERVELKRSSWLSGVQLMYGFNSSRHWKMFHETYLLCCCAGAAGEWRYGKKHYFLEDRSTALMEPGESHVKTRVHKASDFKVLFVEPGTFATAAQDLGLSGTLHFPQGQIEDLRLDAAVQRLCMAVDHDENRLEQESASAACLRLMAEHTERPPSARDDAGRHRGAERVRRYLIERYSEQVGLNEIAAVAGLSRFHVVRAFAQQIGVPPHAYQILVRVERARRLLAAGRAPAEIAADVGFADQSHLTRHFKRVLQVTPGAYARAVR